MLRFLVKKAAIGIAALALSTAIAGAAETWRLAHIVPPDSPEGLVHQRFADLVKEYTGGEVTIQVFPASQLGATPELLQQLEANTIQIFAEDVPVLHRFVADLNWIGLPFMFDDREHWIRFLHSDLVKGYFEKVEADAGITIIGDPTAIMRGPYRVLVTTRPVETVEDVKGLRIRMFENEFFIRAWQTLGAEVIVMAFSDVYESLRLGVLDAVTSPVTLVETMKFYEPAKYVVRTDEFPQSLAYMTNLESWNKLSPETQAEVLRAQEEAATYSLEVTAAAATETLERMKAQGVTFSEPDTAGFTTKMSTLYEALATEGKMPAEVLETIKATREQ
jgi:tripartite ATP-independent transporter DctP family solute receptor